MSAASPRFTRRAAVRHAVLTLAALGPLAALACGGGGSGGDTAAAGGLRRALAARLLLVGSDGNGGIGDLLSRSTCFGHVCNAGGDAGRPGARTVECGGNVRAVLGSTFTRGRLCRNPQGGLRGLEPAGWGRVAPWVRLRHEPRGTLLTPSRPVKASLLPGVRPLPDGQQVSGGPHFRRALPAPLPRPAPESRTRKVASKGPPPGEVARRPPPPLFRPAAAPCGPTPRVARAAPSRSIPWRRFAACRPGALDCAAPGAPAVRALRGENWGKDRNRGRLQESRSPSPRAPP